MENPNPHIGTTKGLRTPDGTPFPTLEELAAGEMANGSPVTLHSKLLNERHPDPIPGDKTFESPFAKDRLDLVRRVDLECAELFKQALTLKQTLFAEAMKVLRGEDIAAQVKPDLILRLGVRCAETVPRTTKAWREHMSQAADRAVETDERRAFMENRAVAVVLHTLLAMDQKFIDVGFGAWMPFRYPDQWLLFCNLLQKVLAANGLIHAKNPDTYRRLLEETPPVESDDFQGPNPGRMPYNWARCWTNRGATTMQELYERCMEEVWFPRHPRAP
jgi:hypothetical protein